MTLNLARHKYDRYVLGVQINYQKPAKSMALKVCGRVFSLRKGPVIFR